jgi:hypothetical protein
MAASKSEVVITHEHNEIAAKFQRLPHIFGHCRLAETVPTLSYVARQPEIAMAASMPEVVTQEGNEIAAKSQRLPNNSTKVDSLELVPTLTDVGRQPEIAMVAYKPEEVITQERHEISVRFQRMLDYFDHPNTQSYHQPCPMSTDIRPTTKNNNGGN